MKIVPDSIKTAFFTVFFIFAFLFIFTKLFGPVPFSVNSINTTKTDLFTVSADGEAAGIPDTALVSLGVTKTSASVEQAKNEVNNSINSIVDGLKNLGIADKSIKTTDYSITPNYDYSSGRSTLTGYSITQNLQAEISPIEKANQALDMAAKNGVNMVGNLQFTLNDKTKAELVNKAREDAVNKAKDKANNLSRISGIRLGKIINVQESTDATPRPIMYDLKAAGAAPEASNQSQIQPGENKVHVSITLSYETF